MEYEQQYHSYLVRLWQDVRKQEEAAIPRWQGEVIHIQSGQSWQIDELEPLLDMLKNLTTPEATQKSNEFDS